MTSLSTIVIGAGVSGLTTAVVLQESGFSVRIWADAFTPRTTSDVAAAIWYPYRAEPEELMREWGRATLREMAKLAGDPATGVRIESGKKLFHRRMGPPWWQEDALSFRLLYEHEVPQEVLMPARCGYQFRIPVADMSIYLRYLTERFEKAGGKLERRHVERASDAFTEASLVVNCTGLGARETAGDTTLFPIRGHVVRIAGRPVSEFLLDTDHPLGIFYIIPRAHDTIVGGSADEGRWDIDPKEDEGKAILLRAGTILPELLEAEILNHRVGLRPGRDRVRLEVERLDGKRLIHNYGHGGSGVTLSWGCALDVLELARLS